MRLPYRIVGMSLIILLFAMSATFFFLFFQRDISFEQKTFRIDDTLFTFELAYSSAQHRQGLQHRTTMPKQHGMAFFFSQPTTPSFWMKNTRIPLDLLWVRQGQVVDITQNIVPEPTRTSDAQLQKYTPSVPVDLVIEINAGEAQLYDMHVGSRVQEVDSSSLPAIPSVSY